MQIQMILGNIMTKNFPRSFRSLDVKLHDCIHLYRDRLL